MHMRLPSRSQYKLFQRRGNTGVAAGAVLLEVVLALVLFVGAAAILTSGLSSSLDSVERLRLNTHAADLAISVQSELQMGIKSLAASGPQPFEAPLESWTWEAVVTPVQTDTDEASPFKRVEVIIRHEDPPLVYRLSQILQIDSAQPGSHAAPGVGSF
jgi:type II secretory pathway pseudopilin PulG